MKFTCNIISPTGFNKLQFHAPMGIIDWTYIHPSIQHIYIEEIQLFKFQSLFVTQISFRGSTRVHFLEKPITKWLTVRQGRGWEGGGCLLLTSQFMGGDFNVFNLIPPVQSPAKLFPRDLRLPIGISACPGNLIRYVNAYFQFRKTEFFTLILW